MEISREMVALVKDYLGRGPTRARTYIRDNLVVCLMQDTMTRAEHSLAREQRQDAVRQVRRLFQDTLRGEATAIVERITGRKVISFLSDHDIDPDFAAEVFVLEPVDDAGEAHRSVDPEARDAPSHP
jgi:uncharacterized protein YbcI